jgi:hypothetical protein
VQMVHQSCTDTNTVYKQTKMRFHTTHVPYEFHRVSPKLIMSLWYVQCKPCTYLVSKITTVSKRTEQRSTRPLSPNRLNRDPMVCFTQTEHLSCTDTNTVSKQTKTRFHMTHVTYEFHQVRLNYCEPVVRSVQTMHLSYVKISTISKRTEQSST